MFVIQYCDLLLTGYGQEEKYLVNKDNITCALLVVLTYFPLSLTLPERGL